ncbi:MAG: copper resistance protein CopC [Mycobacteriales bacterium]
MRSRRALTLLLAALGLFVVLPAVPASAHAFLTDSFPADGAVLATAPPQLRLHFSESVVLSSVHLDVVDAEGGHHTPSSPHLVAAEPGGTTEDPVQVVASLPALPRGAYRVSWQTLSTDDLHSTSGVLVFGIGHAVSAVGSSEPAPRLDEASLRWLLLLSVSLSFGGLLAGQLLRRHDLAAPARRAAHLAVLGAVAGTVVAGGLLVAQCATNGTSAARLLGTAYGARWLLRESGFVLLAAAAAAQVRATGGRLAAVAIATGGTLVCVGSALLGHAGASGGVTQVGAYATHLAAAGAWAGALLVLVLVGARPLRDRTLTTSQARAVLKGFARPAAVCAGLTAVSGVYLASDVVGSVDAALLTTYGRALLAKLALVAAVGVLALANHRRVRSRVQHLVPGRTVVAEVVTLAFVLGLAAVLSSGQPAREPQFVATPLPATVPALDTSVGDLQQELSIRPNQPGRNVLLVGVFDTRRPAPAPIRRVLVSVTGLDGRRTSQVAAERLADGRWSAAQDLAAPGRTSVEVTVQRAGLPDTTHLYRWVVAGSRSTTRRATVSTAPIRGALSSLAAGLAAVLLLGAGSALVRVHRARGVRAARLRVLLAGAVEGG